MAAPGGPVAQLRYSLQCEMMMLQKEPKEPKASGTGMGGRSALLDVLEHLAATLRLCLRADGTDVTTLFSDPLTAEACLHRVPIPWGSNTWALSPPGLVRFAEHAPLDRLRAAFVDLERAGAGLAACYDRLEGDFAAFDEEDLADPRALRLARAIHAGSLATWPHLLNAATISV